MSLIKLNKNYKWMVITTIHVLISGGSTEASAAAAATATAVGLLPRPSVSSYSRWRRLPSFSQMTARVCGEVPSPLIEPKMDREGEGPT